MILIKCIISSLTTQGQIFICTGCSLRGQRSKVPLREVLTGVIVAHGAKNFNYNSEETYNLLGRARKRSCHNQERTSTQKGYAHAALPSRQRAVSPNCSPLFGTATWHIAN
jgi:hypothetical protein